MKKTIKKLVKTAKENFEYYKIGKESELLEEKNRARLSNVKRFRDYGHDDIADKMEGEVNRTIDQEWKRLMKRATKVRK